MSDKSKYIEELHERERNYVNLRAEQVEKAKTMYGENILEDYSLPKNFDLTNLNENDVCVRIDQTCPIPYSNKAFHEFINMPKKVINNIFIKNNKGKNVQGMFLLGKDSNGKYTLFALTIIREIKNPKEYNIKLDVCPQGKTWINVLRIDNEEGLTHPNYLSYGHTVSHTEKINRIPTPHLHVNNQLSQVLFYDDLTHTEAASLTHLIKDKDIKNDAGLIRMLKCMLNIGNIDVKLIENVDTSMLGNYLFSFENVHQITKTAKAQELFR